MKQKVTAKIVILFLLLCSCQQKTLLPEEELLRHITEETQALQDYSQKPNGYLKFLQAWQSEFSKKVKTMNQLTQAVNQNYHSLTLSEKEQYKLRWQKKMQETKENYEKAVQALRKNFKPQSDHEVTEAQVLEITLENQLKQHQVTKLEIPFF